MSKQITLGSLFDGIGGFPLSGAMCGVEPVWASEIEPFPIAVTMNRFPNMKHLGSVTDIRGDQIEPVDIITFGSPCQDLSVAGKQAGIHEGARSNLFFQAVRIIKEMREHDRAIGRTGFDVRPRFAVWENVPGAFSSGKGKDFQAVLQTLCEVADPNVSIPLPEGGWSKAGTVVGKGYSVAWRVYDAQYWGVPQRRKRIYLVADFASERAGEILFESEGVSGNTEKSKEARQGTAKDAEGSARGSCYAFHLQQDPIGGRISPCIGGQHQATVGVFLGGQGAKAGGIGYSERISPTLKSVPSGINQAPDVVYPNIARTLTAEHDSSPCADRGQNVVVHAAGFNDSVGERAKGGMEYTEERSPTLRSGDVRAVVYDARGNGSGVVAPTLTGDHQNRVTDYGKPPRRYIVRRLTPLECCRLQGYPDGWTENVAIKNPTDEQVDFFVEVWTRWAQINGVKPKSRAQVIKWLGDPQSDSAEYKAYGNSLAIPCSSDVLGRIARAMEVKNGYQTD